MAGPSRNPLRRYLGLSYTADGLSLRFESAPDGPSTPSSSALGGGGPGDLDRTVAGTGSGHVPSSFDVLFDAVRPELPGPNRSWTRCCRPARGPLRARAAGFATAGPSWKWIISSR
jgi:hypothetical protein